MPDKSEKQYCVKCGSLMRYSSGAKKWICDKCQLSREAPAPVADTSEKQFCMECGASMRYNWQAKKWVCDNCQLSREAAPPPPAPPKPPSKDKFSLIAIGLAIFGTAVVGGLYLDVPAFLLALYAVHKGEGKVAWTAVAVTITCLAVTVFLIMTW